MDAEIDQRVHSYPKSRGNRWVVKAGLLTCPRSLRLPGECCPSGKECDEWSLPKEGDLQQRVLSRILTGFPFHPYRIKSDGNHDTAKIAIFCFWCHGSAVEGNGKFFTRLLRRLGVNYPVLYRRWKSLTARTPVDRLREVRLRMFF